MSMGIYFYAKRAASVSEAEDAKITEITDKYWKEYPKKDIFEGPGFFSGEDEWIYHGMLRIPMELEMAELEEFFSYWLKWLTDVTNVLHDAEWEAEFEGGPLIWEEEGGWRPMSDEEYAQSGME